MTLSPLTRKKLRRFKSIKRGYYAFIIFAAMILTSMFAEVLVNSRALVVHYQGRYYFPVYGSMIPGTGFGLDYPYETNYRELSRRFQA
ncbi:MAG: ABC transporter permease, partial [Desulfatirhabdiaceae bacterium]|nr:ABC transporter permease [Desulfatirhabdiaceae bacterium]